jgi:peptidyl-prolyl cis-trans isomerase SurA
MLNRKRCWLIALAAVLLQLALARAGAAKIVDRIVAEVNDDIITMSELKNMARSMEAQSGIKPTASQNKKIQRQMLEALIDRKLAKAEAKRRGITVSDKEVNKALDSFKQRNNIPSDEALAKVLANAGLSYKEFRQHIKDQLIQDKLVSLTVGSKIVISDAQVRKVYNEHFKRGGAQLHLASIKLPFPVGATAEQKDEVKRKAVSSLNEVKQGTPLIEAARKLSLNASDLGYISQSDLDPQLAEFLQNLKPKGVVPVETPQGYQLIQLLNRRRGEAQPFQKVAPQIRHILMQQEMGKQFNDWVKTLREKAHIKIMW